MGRNLHSSNTNNTPRSEEKKKKKEPKQLSRKTCSLFHIMGTRALPSTWRVLLLQMAMLM